MLTQRSFGVKSRSKRGGARKQQRRAERITRAEEYRLETSLSEEKAAADRSARLNFFLYLVLFPAMAMPLYVEFGLPEYEYTSPYTKFYKWCLGESWGKQ